MTPRIIPAGERFGRLTVTTQRNVGDKRVQCRCDCGKDHAVPFGEWGKTRSCGCLRTEMLVARYTKHGMCKTSEYDIWAAMIQRTTNPSNQRYADYGGRGIGVCDRWRKFENFLADMGPRPAGMSLDRVDNDSRYSPENCKWASAVEQRRNRRPQRRRPTCKAGHDYTPDNTRTDGDGTRHCRACERAWARNKRERSKAA